MERGWRTIIAGNGERLSLQGGCLIAEGEKRVSVPLCQIREIVLERPRGTVSLALLNAFGEHHIQVLLCDEKSSPRCELSYYPDHHNAAGNINETNRFNLSCDLMEPFRPLADEIVYHNRSAEWDRAYRIRLAEVLRGTVRVGRRRMSLPDAMEEYARDVLAAADDASVKIREVDFEG